MNEDGLMRCIPGRPCAIVVDNHPLIGWGIAQYLQVISPELPVHVTTVWAQAQHWIAASCCPKVLVADMGFADNISLHAFTQWRSQSRGTPWLAIGEQNEPFMMQQARIAGAQGFVHKRASPAVFMRAFSAVLAGHEWYEASALADEKRPHERAVSPVALGLTPRQGDVLELVLRGLSNKRIALMLSLSESTVKEHVTAILQRLGVRNRVHAITLLYGRRLSVMGRPQQPLHDHAMSP